MNRGRGFQHGWWLVLLTLGVMYISAIPFLFIDPERGGFVSMLLGELVLVAPFVVGLFMLSGENLSEGVAGSLGLQSFPIHLLPFVILMPIAAQSFAVCQMLPVNGILIVLFGEVDYGELTNFSGVGEFLRTFFVLCVAAPVMEELLCRGVLMQLFRRYGVVVMLVYSSLAFSIMHMSAQTIIQIFFLGLVLGAIRLTSGSIYASIIAHSASNLYALLAGSAESSGAMLAFMAICVILFPILMYKYLHTCDKKVNWRKGLVIKSSPVGFSAGFAITAAIFVVFNLILLAERLISGAMFGAEMFYY